MRELNDLAADANGVFDFLRPVCRQGAKVYIKPLGLSLIMARAKEGGLLPSCDAKKWVCQRV